MTFAGHIAFAVECARIPGRDNADLQHTRKARRAPGEVGARGQSAERQVCSQGVGRGSPRPALQRHGHEAGKKLVRFPEWPGRSRHECTTTVASEIEREKALAGLTEIGSEMAPENWWPDTTPAMTGPELVRAKSWGVGICGCFNLGKTKNGNEKLHRLFYRPCFNEFVRTPPHAWEREERRPKHHQKCRCWLRHNLVRDCS